MYMKTTSEHSIDVVYLKLCKCSAIMENSVTLIGFLRLIKVYYVVHALGISDRMLNVDITFTYWIQFVQPRIRLSGLLVSTPKVHLLQRSFNY